MRPLGDLGGAVVADVGRKRRHQHQRALQQLGDALPIGLDAARAMGLEARHAVGEQAHALQEIMRDERLVDVQLEVARRAADADGDIVGHDLAAEHGQRLALGRIDLARHDRPAGLVFGNRDLAEP